MHIFEKWLNFQSSIFEDFFFRQIVYLVGSIVSSYATQFIFGYLM